MSIKTTLGKVAHDIALAAEKFKAALVGLGDDVTKDAPEIEEGEQLLAGVATAISPAEGAKVSAAVVASTNAVLKAVQDAGEAAESNGVNLSLDTATIQAVKAALPTVQKEAAAVAKTQS